MSPAKLPISATIITLNEAQNIVRAIQSLIDWVDEVLVVDCGSTDGTTETAKNLGAKVIYNPWPGYGKQKNFAQKQAKNAWILNIDADEEVSPELKNEIIQTFENRAKDESFAAAFPRKTFYLGRWIRHGGWYPDYVNRFYNRNSTQWTEPHVHEDLITHGVIHRFTHPLHHFTFMGIEDQIHTNLRYSRQGFLDLTRKGNRASFFKMIFKPIWKFIDCYWVRLGILDGIPGLIIAINAAHSMFLKYAYFFEDQNASSRH